MEQLAITGDLPEKSPRGKRKTAAAPAELAAVDPVAEVVVDVNAAPLDHPFDFAVPLALDASVLPGCRVRVRFAGRLVDGFVVARRDESEHSGALTAISRVLGPPVLTPEIAELSRRVADRYAGTLNEILRDAVPARHAATEKAFAEADTSESTDHVGPTGVSDAPRADWASYTGGVDALAALAEGKQIRLGLTAAIADDASTLLGDLISAAGSRAVVVVPDGADVAHIGAALQDRFGSAIARLTGDQKPSDRYRNFLRLLHGDASIAIGTRNSVFAPIPDARLVIVWDDLDDSLSETRAPGWHAREVAALRSLHSRASLVIAGYTQSVETAKLIDQKWLAAVEPDRESRRRGPRIYTSATARVGDPAASSRIPRYAWEVISEGLKAGPVLVQVGRRGYLPSLSCSNCREVATCAACSGPLAQSARDGVLACQWCATQYPQFTCQACGAATWRAVRVGSARSAEELQAAFPAAQVLVSDSVTGVLANVPDEPLIVVSTVGAEPVAATRFAAAVLLDGDAQLAGSHLRSGEQVVRRWFNAAAAVRPAAAGGAVAITADPAHRAVQALVRCDAAGWAQRELAERRDTDLPPVTRSVAMTGPLAAIEHFVQVCAPLESWRVLGPTPHAGAGVQPNSSRIIILVPTAEGGVLSAKVKSALVAGADGSGANRVVVRMDPLGAL